MENTKICEPLLSEENKRYVLTPIKYICFAAKEEDIGEINTLSKAVTDNPLLNFVFHSEIKGVFFDKTFVSLIIEHCKLFSNNKLNLLKLINY